MRNEPNRREHRIQTICLIVLASLASAVALWWLGPVLIPLVVALFMTWTLSPVIDMQINRLRVPRMLAMLTTFLLGIALIGLLALVIAASVGEMNQQGDAYAESLRSELFQVATFLGLDPSIDRPQDSFAVHIPVAEIRSSR